MHVQVQMQGEEQVRERCTDTVTPTKHHTAPCFRQNNKRKKSRNNIDSNNSGKDNNSHNNNNNNNHNFTLP
jgi:hypothetical protein